MVAMTPSIRALPAFTIMVGLAPALPTSSQADIDVTTGFVNRTSKTLLPRIVVDIVAESKATCEDGLYIEKPQHSLLVPINILPYKSHELLGTVQHGRRTIVRMLLGSVDEMNVIIQTILEAKGKDNAGPSSGHGSSAAAGPSSGHAGGKRPATETAGGRGKGKAPVHRDDFADPAGKRWQRAPPQAGLRQAWPAFEYDPTQYYGIDLLAVLKKPFSELYVGSHHEAQTGQPWDVIRPVSSRPYRRQGAAGAKVDHGPNVGFRWEQTRKYPNQEYKQGRVQLDPTDAEYAAIFNPVDGVLVAQVARGPCQTASGLSKDFPPNLRTWSDVIWAQWTLFHSIQYLNPHPNDQTAARPSFDFRGTVPAITINNRSVANEMRAWLNFILVIGNGQREETLRTIATCLHSNKVAFSTAPGWDHRQTFPIGHWCFYALLAAENSVGVVDFLVEHKAAEELGTKAFKSVTIFWPADPSNSASPNWPALLWEIVEASAIKTQEQRSWEAMWEHKDNYADHEMPTVYRQIGGAPSN